MRPISKAGGAERADEGFTYVVVLVLLVAVAMLAQAVYVPPQIMARQDAEKELIFRGLAYRRAIESYWKVDLGDHKLPQDINELLFDPRSSGKRHIRRLYASPIGKEWRLILRNGGIAGVAPTADGAPLRRYRFPAGLSVTGDGDAYSDWEFVYVPEHEQGRR